MSRQRFHSLQFLISTPKLPKSTFSIEGGRGSWKQPTISSPSAASSPHTYSRPYQPAVEWTEVIAMLLMVNLRVPMDSTEKEVDDGPSTV